MRYNVHDRDFCVVKTRVLFTNIQSEINQLDNLLELSLQGMDRSYLNKTSFALKALQEDLDTLWGHFKAAMDEMERQSEESGDDSEYDGEADE